MTMLTCRGSSLHFFDAGAGKSGSDKFYNAFYYYTEAGRSKCCVLVHWGRDGTTGQAAEYPFGTTAEAQEFLDNKIREKLRKGYTPLGSGQVKLDIPASATDARTALGREFARAIRTREPDKTRMTGGFLIAERPDAEDLMADLMARKP